MKANPEKMEPNLGEKAVVERQDIPNKQAEIRSLRTCRKERMAYQEATEANPEKVVPYDRVIAILEKMDATDLKANPEEMESESEHWEVPRKMP
jgi:hypothetical protein